MLLRLPADLHAALVALARQEERSLHGQIVYLLRRGIERRDETDRPESLPPRG